MRYLVAILVLTLGSNAWGQTSWEKTIPVDGSQKVELSFTHPELITINTWDKNEIKIQASVSINFGGNDNAFEISSTAGETLRIKSEIKDFENIPRNIVIMYQGNEYFFKTSNMDDPEILKFREGKENFDYIRHGVIKKIKLKITVPRNIKLELESKFGMVEVVGFSNQMEINSKFGGIDVTVDDGANASMELRTKFGDVYSNLGVRFSSDDVADIGRWNTIVGKVNNGQKSQSLKSEFGNIYLRKM